MPLLQYSLENPYLLPLLLLAFLPLLLHLLDRQRARVVEWPAMRFLVPRNRGRLRWIQRREAILILLRSILIVLMVLALLHPFSTREQAVIEGHARGRGAVLLLDSSFSMAYRETPGGPSSLEKARDAAFEILAGFSPGDRVAVWTQTVVAGEGQKLVMDAAAAQSTVRDLEPDGGSFRLLDALDLAADLLPQIHSDSREIYILSDLQASTLPERDPARYRFVAERLRAGGTPPSIRLIDCGSAHPINRWVASLVPDLLAAGTDEPTDLRAAIESLAAPSSQDPISVRLLADGAVVESAQVALPEIGGKATVALAHRFQASGDVQISVEIPRDGLAEDDSRRLVLEVLDRVDVLILGTSGAGDSAGAARFVDLALAPRARDLTAPPLIFRVAFTDVIDAPALASCRVLVMTGKMRLGAPAAALVERFVRGGGGLIIFASDETDTSSLTDQLYRDGRGILPTGLAAGGRGESASGTNVHPSEITTQHPALAIFKDPEEGDLTRIAIHRWTRVRSMAPDSRVLARVNAESPWIVERTAGAGKVILITTSAASDDSDLPRTPLFLPLLHCLVRYIAAPDVAARALLAGEPISLPLPEVASGEVIDPSGKKFPIEATLEGGAPRLLFRNTRLPGFYEVRAPDPQGAGQVRSRFFAVNVAPEESRLDRLGEDALGDLRSALGVELLRDSHETAGALVVETVKLQHWPAIVAAAIAFLFAEQLLARSFARGRAKWRPGSQSPT